MIFYHYKVLGLEVRHWHQYHLLQIYQSVQRLKIQNFHIQLYNLFYLYFRFLDGKMINNPEITIPMESGSGTIMEVKNLFSNLLIR